MYILEGYASFEFTEKNSRFLSELFPCQNQADAKKIIKLCKEKYNNASHIVHAFVLGLNCEILGMSDDGEPSGTAGPPVLEMLKGANITNSLLTVTRWFGGTLLGTGGLVKAYRESAKKVIEAAKRENKIILYVEKKYFKFECSYSFYKTALHILKSFDVYEYSEEFLENVLLKGAVPASDFQTISELIKNSCAGRFQLQSST